MKQKSASAYWGDISTAENRRMPIFKQRQSQTHIGKRPPKNLDSRNRSALRMVPDTFRFRPRRHKRYSALSSLIPTQAGRFSRCKLRFLRGPRSSPESRRCSPLRETAGWPGVFRPLSSFPAQTVITYALLASFRQLSVCAQEGLLIFG